MISVVTIDHIVLHAGQNFTKMLTFYTQVLGCNVERELPEFNLTQLRAGHAIIDLLNDPKHQTNPHSYNVEHFCLTIEQAIDKKLIDALNALEIETTQISHNYGAQGFADSVYIKDPQGNSVELKQTKTR